MKDKEDCFGRDGDKNSAPITKAAAKKTAPAAAQAATPAQ